MNKFIVSCLIMVFAGLSLITEVLGESKKSEEHVAAVQERIFFKYHELDANIGYISDDDFHHLFPIGIGYAFNFNDIWAWKVLDSLL
ncbi:MAG: hypothetical protein KKB94_11220, partial [Proteobacteria bacterium]|nr:hypothetical protein [Pseudomonadota bacterium]